MSNAPWDDPDDSKTPPDDTETTAPNEPLDVPAPRGHEPGEDPEGEFECPECGKRFKRPLHRGLHRKKQHGILGSGGRDKTPKNRAGEKRRPSGGASSADAPPSASGSESRRRRVIKETLLELADLADSALGRGFGASPQTLTEIVRRDSDKQATAVAGLASRFEPLGSLIDVVFGAGGPLSFVLAFGPTLRKLRELAGERRQAQEEEAWQQMQQVPPELQSQPVEWPPA